MPDLTAPLRRAIAIGAVIVLLALVVFVLAWCSERRESETAKDQTTISDARTKSAGEAIQTQDDVTAQKGAIDDKVETGVDAIRKARNPAARNDAALRSLCDVDPSASADCRLLQPRP